MRRGTGSSVFSAAMLVIRKAEPRDVPDIRQLVLELAEYEREPEAVVATEANLLADGFGPEPRYHCLMAEWDGATAGFALYFHTYSTWLARWGLFLEDLVVRPQHRSRGIGKALLLQLGGVTVWGVC